MLEFVGFGGGESGRVSIASRQVVRLAQSDSGYDQAEDDPTNRGSQQPLPAGNYSLTIRCAHRLRWPKPTELLQRFLLTASDRVDLNPNLDPLALNQIA